MINLDTLLEQLKLLAVYDYELYSRAMQEAARLAKNGMGEKDMQLRNAIDESKMKFNRCKGSWAKAKARFERCFLFVEQ